MMGSVSTAPDSRGTSRQKRKNREEQWKKYFTNITNLISSQQVDVATKEILSKKYDGEVDKVFQEIRKEGNNFAHAIDSGYEKIKNKGKSKQVIGDSLQI